MTLLSPGVAVQERDFSLIVPTVATSVGGIVGRFLQGPVETPVLLSSEADLVNIFGLPNDTNANDWHTAAEFLKYTNSLWAVRSANTGMKNATSSGTGFKVFNRDDYEALTSGNKTTIGEFAAKNAGTVGNGLGVIVLDAATWTYFTTWCTTNIALFPDKTSLASYFNAAPSTTPYVAGLALDNTPKLDEIHVLIVDVLGKVTGDPYTILEKFEGCSKASDAVDYRGLSIYYVNVINESSKYVWWSSHPTSTSAGTDVAIGSIAYDVAPATKQFAQINIVSVPNFFGGASATTLSNLTGGVVGTSSTNAEVKTAYDKLANKDLYNIGLVMAGAFGLGAAGEIEQYVVENVAALRKDCVAFISPHTSGAPIRDGATSQATVAAFKTSVAVPDDQASYGFMDTGMKYIYDRYSKKYRWVPLNGDTAGLAARTDSSNDPWWPFAGFNRGGIKNVIKFAFNPNQADRDYLYPKGINPCIMDPSSGPVLFGDRTMTSKPSAFDRVNVRRLFIVLEKSISIAAKWQLFEFNDTFTRALFKNMVEPYLRMIQGRRGITDFKVICDSTNNTGEIIDRNEFRAEIYIKPARSINFITLTFVATRTDVSFSTVVGGA